MSYKTLRSVLAVAFSVGLTTGALSVLDLVEGGVTHGSAGRAGAGRSASGPGLGLDARTDDGSGSGTRVAVGEHTCRTGPGMSTPPDDRTFRREMATAYRSGWHFIDLLTALPAVATR